MVAPAIAVENLISGVRLSSVGPARVTGTDVIHEPTSMDLAMKLHYIRAVYYFRSSSVEGLGLYTIKEAMFRWFNLYPHTCGRFRRSDSGHPFIKCNDCGARFIEAQCSKTLDEWLEMKECSLHNLLVSNQVLGPDLGFSPSILIQMTTFQCGGVALSFSWAHVLGDAFSLSEFLYLWSQIMAGHQPPNSPLPKPETKASKSKNSSGFAVEPLSVKRVEPVGDHWIAANTGKMENYSFQITAQQLKVMISKMFQTSQIRPFEFLSAVFWKYLARIREGSEPKTVTISRKDSHNREKGTLCNNQIINTVQAYFSVAEANPKDLVELIMEQKIDEKRKIEELVEQDGGLSDLIMYGANLTFLDLEEADLYGLELKKEKPVFVNYTIDGVGDEGLILVMKAPSGAGSWTVTVILPENEILKLNDELQREWSIA
ncbi:protein ECERIFERUM 26-like [Macadamia integrifolia]|uniref:protein ECERIFERUM 26-like n=1 Tax=Macadamia integrifolia TaxID=60698 RepID=UPI001C502204|nr:protein ECERIFERUM 26-like [Macadamia integrifolia]